MWDVLQTVGREAPAIAAAALVALMIGLAAFRFWDSRSGDFFDFKKSETASASALAVKIISMSAEQNKTIASQCATIAAQQSQIVSLRAEIEKCVAECAQCYEEREKDRAARAAERTARDKEITSLKAAIAAIKAA